jgi:PqqA peptide cyclase
VSTTSVAPPLGLLAELTHRCPLHCPYCSNPAQLTAAGDELTTEQWRFVLTQARDLGVLQVHLSGGEPLARADLGELVAHASGLGCYVSLVTSGVGLSAHRLTDLAGRGLDHVQLSLQGADPRRADDVAGHDAHRSKLAAAATVTTLGLPLTVNVVLHRQNLDEVGAIIDTAETLGASRLELANAQYYGWAARNRALLMPTAGQLAAAEAAVRAATERSGGAMEVVYVVADYYESRPKACMHGWGSRQLTVAPDGDVLPCPAAQVIDTLEFENAAERPLAQIWYESEAFNAFRGDSWMREPCASCDDRATDHGGCRCQAFMLTGSADATDPVCTLSPVHEQVVALRSLDDEPREGPITRQAFVTRRMPTRT